MEIKTVQGQSKRVLLEVADKVVLNIITSELLIPWNSHCFMVYTKEHLLTGMLRKRTATVSEGSSSHRAPEQPQHGNGSSEYLQLKGTALSQKLNVMTGDVFPSEKWAIQSSAGEKRWLKREKKKMEKKSQNCGNNLCISIPQLLHLSIGIQKHLGQHLKVNNVHRAIWTKLQAKIKA